MVTSTLASTCSVHMRLPLNIHPCRDVTELQIKAQLNIIPGCADQGRRPGQAPWFPAGSWWRMWLWSGCWMMTGSSPVPGPAASCRSCQEKPAAAIITAPAPAQQLLTHPADQAAPHTALPEHHSPYTSPRFWRSPIFRLVRSLINISISMFATLSTQYMIHIKLFSLMALFLSQTAAVKLSNGPRNKRNRYKIFLHVLPYVSQRHLCNISWKKCV